MIDGQNQVDDHSSQISGNSGKTAYNKCNKNYCFLQLTICALDCVPVNTAIET